MNIVVYEFMRLEIGASCKWQGNFRNLVVTHVITSQSADAPSEVADDPDVQMNSHLNVL